MWSTFTAGLQIVQEKLLEGEQDEKERVRYVRKLFNTIHVQWDPPIFSIKGHL